ncbi:chromosome transmission fidelity protein 18 homolog, partial [Stegodyphus dumicola]|uniref:chromosome transmission fidelity protein 18 homolog n=1 Tax=Stegodyphus dumicola TaxID=202533 RepID=UPI0015AD65CC
MDFLTEEELFELQHQEELETLNELDSADPDEYDFDPFSFAMKKHSSSSKNENNSNIKASQIPVLKDNLPKGRKESSNHSGNSEHCSINYSVSNEDCDKTEEKENCVGGVVEPVKSTTKDVLEISSSPLKHVENSEYCSSLAPRTLFIDESMCTEDNACPDESDSDLECSESLISQSGKRKFSKLSDNEDESLLQAPGKKQCHSLENSPKLQPSKRMSIADKPVSFFEKERLPLTRSDGRRIYFFVNEEDDEKNIVPSFSQRTSTLLSTPIEELKSQYFIMEENTLKSGDIQASQSDNLQMDTTEDLIEERKVESLLWVEKYRPLSYMHLLSEEGINRTLLHWLKLWDKVVFGREKKRKKKNIEPQKEKKFQKTYGELIEDLDEYGRPHHKVAFLSGPPGLGKTTLAVIIAKQAGYNVVELNASDDRNPEAFRTQLEAATQMKSVLQQDKRPNCLVLDEIDGAPAQSINVLLSFIKSTGITRGKRKKGDIPLLMRPLICICNDPYSTALKPLRQLALVLNFPPTTSSRLTARLNEVSLKEGLIAEMAALTLLCEKTSNDIRSCLSTLQFIHRKQKELKVHDLKGLHIGQKDVQKSLFVVWQDIFHAKNSSSFNAIYQTIQAFGDYEKVYIGVLENYLNIKFKRNLDAVWEGPEWLCFVDIIQQQIAQNQLFFLLPYLPYPAITFHLLYAQNTFPHILYPSAYYE